MPSSLPQHWEREKERIEPEMTEPFWTTKNLDLIRQVFQHKVTEIVDISD